MGRAPDVLLGDPWSAGSRCFGHPELGRQGGVRLLGAPRSRKADMAGILDYSEGDAWDPSPRVAGGTRPAKDRRPPWISLFLRSCSWQSNHISNRSH